jgi:hypothetical protein
LVNSLKSYPTKSIEKDVYDALATTEIKLMRPCEPLRFALLTAAYMHEKDNFVNARDVKRCGSTSEMVSKSLEANDLIVLCREWLQAALQDAKDVKKISSKVLGAFMNRIALTLLAKSKSEPYESLNAVAHALVLDTAKELCVEFASPWGPAPSESAPSAASVAADEPYFRTDGLDVAQLLKEKGFTVGCTVHSRRAPKDLFTLESIKGDPAQVGLVEKVGMLKSHLDMATFFKHWCQAKVSDKEEFIHIYMSTHARYASSIIHEWLVRIFTNACIYDCVHMRLVFACHGSYICVRS